ncbi:MAG: hypothetical protein L3K26_19695 [Candidatus Hydrogenedentes bacterium]|nr:hypothetical protein [Candidatus Hydrogenedentota bacterium]
MSAMKTFVLGLLHGPRWIFLWVLVVLMGVNMVAPLAFWGTLEAKVVLVTFMMALTARFGFTRILGLGHIFWIPLIAFLFTRWGLHPADTPMGIWLRVVILINGASLVMDGIDVVRYVRGEREPTVRT